MMVSGFIVAGALVVYWIVAARANPEYSFCPLKEDLKLSSWVWSALFWAVGLFMAVYAGRGLVVETSPGAWVALEVAVVAGTIVSLWREPIRERLADVPASWLIELAILGLGSYLSFIAIEMPSNPYLTSFNLYGMLIEIVVIFLVMAVLHLVFQRTGIGAAVACVLFFIAGLAEYFVVEFKGTPIMASDVLAIGTAATVSGDYTYTLNGSAISGLALMLATVLLLSLTPKRERATKRSVLTNCTAALVLVVALGVGLTQINITNTWGIIVGGWAPLMSYYRQGFVTSFITSVQDLSPKQPEGYSNASAKKLLGTYAAQYDETLGASEARKAAEAQYAAEKPTVIFVMNESFSDLSRYKQLGCGYTGPSWFNSYTGALRKGTLYVSPYGGGTCNSEFEFLTGCSTTFIGTGVYPYMVYDLSKAPSLAAQLKGEGYATCAMHPNRAANWNRNVVYPAMGFDRFMDIYDFSGSARLRGKVTDAATYAKIEELLASDDAPQFICDITMQNHGGYDTGLLPADMVSQHLIDGVDDPDLDEYLALIDESDRALEDFIERLSKLKRHVVVVFFGDHQPKIASAYNDQFYSEEDPNSIDHIERTRETEYMVWANYQVAGVETLNDTTPTSTNYLAAEVMNLIGAPLSDFQKARLVLKEQLPYVNLVGYQAADGVWHEEDNQASAGAQWRNQLWALTYYELWRDGVSYQTGSGAAGIL